MSEGSFRCAFCNLMRPDRLGLLFPLNDVDVVICKSCDLAIYGLSRLARGRAFRLESNIEESGR